MDRREFFKHSIRYLAAGGLLWTLGRTGRLFAAEGGAEAAPDIVAVRNGMPDVMFDAGIKALGGMGRFVKSGQTVVVKPNIGWNTSPEQAGCTNPLLVKRIIEHCYQAGAKKVYVFDHTCNYWEDCYRTSGIQDAVKDADGQVAPGNSEQYYQKVTVPGAKYISSAKVHELILSSDVFINVPVLKQHGSSRITAGMKNLMGIVWDRGVWHGTDLHRCISDFCACRRPDLNVVDAYRVMTRNGPRGVSLADVREDKMQVLSTDIVAADAASVKIFGQEPSSVPYLVQAHEKKFGRMDIENLSVNRITI